MPCYVLFLAIIFNALEIIFYSIRYLVHVKLRLTKISEDKLGLSSAKLRLDFTSVDLISFLFVSYSMGHFLSYLKALYHV